MRKTVKLMSKAAVLMLMLSLTGCYYDDLQVAEIPVIEDVSFSADIQTIFNDNNCMECHNASRNPDLREGHAYASLVPTFAMPNDSNGSPMMAKMMGGHRSLGANEIALIKSWIDQGAKNN
jgi:hypothetical protein